MLLTAKNVDFHMMYRSLVPPVYTTLLAGGRTQLSSLAWTLASSWCHTRVHVFSDAAPRPCMAPGAQLCTILDSGSCSVCQQSPGRVL